MGDFIAVDNSNFEAEVLKSATPAIVEFGGQFCKPCKNLEPLLAELGREWAGKIRLCKVDVEESPELALRYQIMSVPTTILFSKGQPCASLTGLQPAARIRDAFLPYL